jgi:hypothetical protein
MSLGRLAILSCILLTALVLISCSSSSPSGPGETDSLIELDLSTFPETGLEVPNGTILGDQWASIGILFDAEPTGVDAIVQYWGEAHLFFSPDTLGAIAVFSFVDVDGRTPTDISLFKMRPWFDPEESAELVGLDEGGAEVAIATVTPDDIGYESQGIWMEIEGTFRTVEWRTHGNPGIAVGYIAFEF